MCEFVQAVYNIATKKINTKSNYVKNFDNINTYLQSKLKYESPKKNLAWTTNGATEITVNMIR